MAWDPEAYKGLRKRRWRGGLLEPGEGLHGAQICLRLGSIPAIAAAHGWHPQAVFHRLGWKKRQMLRTVQGSGEGGCGCSIRE